MRDPKRIPRILRKLEKAWKKNPDLRLIQLLFHLTEDPDKRLEPFYVEDRHLEEILDKKVPQKKLTITFGHLFNMRYLTSCGEARAVTDAFIRDVRSSTKTEFFENPGVSKMNTKDWYAAKLDGYRIVLRPDGPGSVELLDILNEESIQFFKAQQDKELKAKA